MAVPAPIRTAPSSHQVKVPVIAVRTSPAACTHIPAAIKVRRPMRSLSEPVTIWRNPQTAG
jgi:hypothetical protein